MRDPSAALVSMRSERALPSLSTGVFLTSIVAYLGRIMLHV
jgi:hypothetical protein